ncbi:MAG: hypothetical protein KDE47_20315, partial [Caldilineaceae bacterium]|nr:hypothetical protein [Caldilineaceae bacterium]
MILPLTPVESSLPTSQLGHETEAVARTEAASATGAHLAWTEPKLLAAAARFFAAAPAFAQATAPGNVGTDLTLWVRADANVYSDAGTTAATDGGAVQQWNDLSGNGSNATQATLARRPFFQTAGANFNPTLDFRAANFLTTPDNDLLGGDGTPYTKIVVADLDVTNRGNAVLGTSGANGSLLYFASTDYPRIYHVNTTVVNSNQPGSVTPNRPYILIARYDPSGLGNLLRL